jgi:hypothetical protein
MLKTGFFWFAANRFTEVWQKVSWFSDRTWQLLAWSLSYSFMSSKICCYNHKTVISSQTLLLSSHSEIKPKFTCVFQPSFLQKSRMMNKSSKSAWFQMSQIVKSCRLWDNVLQLLSLQKIKSLYLINHQCKKACGEVRHSSKNFDLHSRSGSEASSVSHLLYLKGIAPSAH